MVSRFRAVADEFCTEVQVIQALVSSFDTTQVKPKLRAAASNSAMLLLAATFEVFVRDMAGAVARAAVAGAGEVAHIPNGILRTAWKRVFDSIARLDLPQNTRIQDIHQIVGHAEARSGAVFAFLRGNTEQEIFADLVQHDVNLRTQEINRLFGISGVSDVCGLVSQEQNVADHFQADRASATGKELVEFIDRFIEQRNSIAHSLTSASSVGANEVSNHIDTFRVFATALCVVLEQRFPPAGRRPVGPVTTTA